MLRVARTDHRMDARKLDRSAGVIMEGFFKEDRNQVYWKLERLVSISITDQFKNKLCPLLLLEINAVCQKHHAIRENNCRILL